MFIVAVAQPLHNYNKHVRFDGKLGCWPLTEVIPFKRNRKNRPKGKMVTTPVTSVTKEVVKEVLINKLIPDIVTKFPRDCKEIHVQMDNTG